MCRVPKKLEDGVLCGTMHKKVADWTRGSMLIDVYSSIIESNQVFLDNNEDVKHYVIKIPSSTHKLSLLCHSVSSNVV